MSLLSVVKRILGFQSDLETAFRLAGLLVQKIEDSSLSGADKLDWVKGQLEAILPAVAPQVFKNWHVNWPKVNAYIDALVMLAKVAGVFAPAVK